jgi:hypothetical protein
MTCWARLPPMGGPRRPGGGFAIATLAASAAARRAFACSFCCCPCNSPTIVRSILFSTSSLSTAAANSGADGAAAPPYSSLEAPPSPSDVAVTTYPTPTTPSTTINSCCNDVIRFQVYKAEGGRGRGVSSSSNQHSTKPAILCVYLAQIKTSTEGMTKHHHTLCTECSPTRWGGGRGGGGGGGGQPTPTPVKVYGTSTSDRPSRSDMGRVRYTRVASPLSSHLFSSRRNPRHPPPHPYYASPVRRPCAETEKDENSNSPLPTLAAEAARVLLRPNARRPSPWMQVPPPTLVEIHLQWRHLQTTRTPRLGSRHITSHILPHAHHRSDERGGGEEARGGERDRDQRKGPSSVWK